MLSVANKDRGTIGNSYWPIATVSLISIFWPALALHHTCGKGPILLKLHNLVCCSHPHDLCTGFPCKEFSLLHGRPRLTLPDWTRSFTKQSNSLLPISLCSHKSSFTVSGITTLVTRLNRLVCVSENGCVNLSIVAVNCATSFSSCTKTAVVKF